MKCSQTVPNIKKKAQEIRVCFRGPSVSPEQLLGSTGVPGLCAKQIDIRTTEGLGWAGLDCRGLLCLGVGIIPRFLFTPPPHPQLLPLSQFTL